MELLRSMRLILRALSLGLALCSYSIVASIIYCSPFSQMQRRRWAGRLVGFMSNFGLWLLGIRVKIKGNLPNGARLLICNHLSYIDVLIIAAKCPNIFVTSQEIRASFPLGWWAAIGGCVFVERRNRNRIQEEVDEIANLLRDGFSVTVFPEATSTNGDTVLPFKNSMFGAAIDTLTTVQPMALIYDAVDDKPLDEKSRDSVFWYGDMDFAPHIIKVMKLGRVDVTLNLLAEMPMAVGQCRKTLAANAHELILKCYTQASIIRRPETPALRPQFI